MSRRSGRKTAYEKSDSKSSDANSAEIDEQEEVTRCVCGNDELAAIDASLVALLQTEYRLKVDTGLFIQCEKCSVWQHGYCVGLFASEDVPDKYWCEECKPDLHRMVEDANGAVRRTLYRSVNDSRKALLESSSVDPSAVERAESGSGTESKPPRSRSRRSPHEASPEDGGRDSDTPGAASTRQARKDRRHGDSQFDEQLQKALRESSRGSKKAGDNEAAGKRTPSEESEHDESERDVKKETRTKPRARPKPKQAKPRTPAKDEEVSKDELLSQSSRPRFVDEKSTIYELRKRTGAILEWLGRTQMELEEERDAKRRHVGDAAVVLPSYDDNLRLMENLTEKILSWEQRFGKYAP